MTDAPTYEMLAKLPARRMSIGLALSWQAARDPDRPALSMGDITFSRMELDRIVNRRARAFAAMGIGKDDNVAVVLPTGPMHQITCQALWKLGASVIVLPPKLVDFELQKLLELANPVLTIGVSPERLPGWKTLPADFPVEPELSDEPLPEAIASRWKASTSGGSTGIPKLLWDTFTSEIHPEEPLDLLGLQCGDVIVHPAAAYHNSPFVQTNWALAWGCHVILMEKFDARGWLRLVEEYKVDWAYLVPTMMSRILALSEEERLRADVTSLRVVIHMAAPCPPWVKAAWIDWLGPERILEVYAGTEGYGSTLLTGQEWLEHPGTVGKAPPETQVRDEEGSVLPTGETGLLWFLPPPGNMMNLPQEYFTYGDMGYLDADGYLYIADRRTDMIVCGGGNIYPAEIEAAIERFPGVVAAAVIGLPHDDLGAVPHAIIEFGQNGPVPEPAELSDFLRKHLTITKHPRTFEIATEPLRDDAGKMRRSRLREERLGDANRDYIRMA